MFRIFIFSFFLIGCIKNSTAQELVITYDYLTGQSEFYHKSRSTLKPVKNISITEGTQVKVEVRNINPYLWKVYPDLQEAKAGGFNLGSGIQTLLSGMKMSPGNLINGFFGSNPFTALSGARGNERSAIGFLRETGDYFFEVADSIKSLRAIHTELELLEQLLATLEITDRLSESEFKGKLNQYIRQYAGWQQNEMDVAIHLGLTQDAQRLSYTDSLHLLYEQIHMHASKSTALAVVFPETGLTVQEYVASIDSSYLKILGALQTLENDRSFQQLHFRIFQKYNQMRNASFSQQQLIVSPFVSDQLKLLFVNQQQKDSLVRLLALPNSSKAKIFNTNGIVLPFFKENKYEYFVGEDSLIRSDALSPVTPYLAAQVNITRPYSSALKWAYNIGLGLPMSSEKGLLITTGLSLIFGKNDFFSFTTGIAGTKMKTLARGLKVGDKVLAPLAPLPYKDVLALAPFVSLTFNMAALK